MATRKPLVLDDAAQQQQLQTGDELDIPLEARVARLEELEERFNLLVTFLVGQGIELPEEIINPE